MTPKISFLKTRDIREVWKREDKHFTPWLANPEPISMLLEACGIEAGENLTIEKEVKVPGVGRMLDVLVTINGNEISEKIAIENQYSEGDHDHLTRALAYAVGHKARTIIVIAESHRAEFISVANYLNSAAAAHDEGISIFLVEVSAWSAEDADHVFPTFEVVARPDEWKTMVADTQGTKQGSQQKAINYEFHDLMIPLVRKTTGLFTNSRPSSSNGWKAGWFGMGGVAVVYGVLKGFSFAQIWFFRHGHPEASAAGFEALAVHKDAIAKKYPHLEFNWKADRRYPVIETRVEGLTDTRPFAEKKLEELADVTGIMSDIVREYKSEIALAMGPK